MRMPQSSAMRASRGAFRLAWSQPMRIFSVTGTGTARTVASRMRGGGDLVAHQRAAGHLADRDLLHRAAEIDVDDVGAATDGDPRRLGHRRRIAAGELDGATGAAVELRPCAACCGSRASSPRRRSSPTPPARRPAARASRRNGRSVTPDIGARITGVSIRTPRQARSDAGAGRCRGVVAHDLGSLTDAAWYDAATRDAATLCADR